MSDCPREQEALELVRAGRWPNGCDEELRAHVAACADCGGSVQVASLMASESNAAMRTAHVPGSGLVWWRVQRRAREEAARTAARLVTAVQAVTVTIGIAAAVSIAGADTVSHVLASVPKEVMSVIPQWTTPVLLGLTAWLALAPVAVYLAVTRD
jgi:predicted anti-sigma-YlaC factor YlaD